MMYILFSWKIFFGTLKLLIRIFLNTLIRMENLIFMIRSNMELLFLKFLIRKKKIENIE